MVQFSSRCQRSTFSLLSIAAAGLISLTVLSSSAIAQRLEAVTANTVNAVQGSVGGQGAGDRAQLEYTLLEMMRGNLPVTPKGAGLVAYSLAEFVASGKISTAQAIEISALAGIYARSAPEDRKEEFADFVFSVSQIADEATLTERTRSMLLRTIQGLR